LPHCEYSEYPYEYSEYPCEYSEYRRGPGLVRMTDGQSCRAAAAVRRTTHVPPMRRAGVLAVLDCAAKSAAAVRTAARPLRQCCPRRTGMARRQQTKPQPRAAMPGDAGLLAVATGCDWCNMQPKMLRGGRFGGSVRSRTHARILSGMNAHSLTHARTHTHTQALADAHTHTHTHTHTSTGRCTHTPTCARTQTRNRTRVHRRARTQEGRRAARGCTGDRRRHCLRGLRPCLLDRRCV
jgi:hypothetical protein